MKDEIDEIFDSKLLDQSIKKAKRRSRRRIVEICITLFIVGSIVNFGISNVLADKFSEARDIKVASSIPNGFVMEARDTIGFLGGRSEYKIAKQISGRYVVIENEDSGFGMINNFIYISRVRGMWGTEAGAWPEEYWEYGYKKMLFFHPEVSYKTYKNDLSILDKLSDMQLVEMGLSFDKGYNEWEVGKFLEDFEITWVWIDDYSGEQLDEWRYEAENYDAKQCYIKEGNTFGISIHGNIINEFENRYEGMISEVEEHNKKRYKALKEVGLDQLENAKIIGVTVQGTPEELKALSEVKEIKGATMGCVVNTY